MNKKITALLIVVSLVIGGVIGAYIDHYYYIIRPYKIASENAKKEQKHLNKMVREGVVTKVKPHKITVKIDKAGVKEAEGKSITVDVGSFTNLQNGPNIISLDEVPVDIKEYIKPKMEVSMLVDSENKARAIYWETKDTP